MSTIAEGIRAFISTLISPVERDLRDLHARVEALERRGVVIKDCGPWESKVYEVGDAVTWDGSLWLCQVAGKNMKPGYSGQTVWRLAVKRGRDGKCRCARSNGGETTP